MEVHIALERQQDGQGRIRGEEALVHHDFVGSERPYLQRILAPGLESSRHPQRTPTVGGKVKALIVLPIHL
jgi:hypothetical protein